MSVALLIMAVSANASRISYTTNPPLTEFVAGINSLTLDSTGGQAATLIFTPNTSFTFDLVVDDTNDGAAVEFADASAGGPVSINSSTIQFRWQSLLSIGPGANNTLSGNLGTTAFDIVSPTSPIVTPDSGISRGSKTIQRQVSSIQEPATDSLIGGVLLGLGFMLRKNFLRR
jgi:hypothetical protein